jgi:hypothetical protein
MLSLQPIDGSLSGLHGSQARIAPEIGRDNLKFQRVNGAPLLLQSMRAGGDPEVCRCVVHGPKNSNLLYAYPVLCLVYVLRRHGEKLPPDIVRSHPNAGWLYLGEDTRKFYPQVACRLFRDSKSEVDVIEPLICATVKTIKNGGLLISGQQEVRSNVTHRQAWWCIPGPMDDTTVPG